jgi:protein O-GlcNAc transferase
MAESRSTALVRLLRSGNLEEAARSLPTPPETAEDWRTTGIFYAWRHEWHSSQTAFQHALNFEEPNAEWWCDLGLALIGSGAPEQALTALERSLALKQSALAMMHMGEALELLSRDTDAYARFRSAIELEPNLVEAIDGVVRLACKLGHDEEALRQARRAARLHRFNARSLQILADMQFYSSQLQTCLRTYRRAMRADPASPGIHSAYLFASIHDPRQTPASLRALHEEWFRLHASPRDLYAFPHIRHPKPRIGYVSVEFRSSPAEYFLLPLLEAHDRDQFDIYCYHFSRRDDEITLKYQQAATHWRNLSTSSQDEGLRTIRADQLDILVDTSGHFDPRIQSVLARRAAPVQMLLPIYPASTGCPELDYVITDRWTTPDADSETQYRQQVCRLPSGYVIYAPPSEAPAPNALPALQNGYLTFGLFQRPAKFNDGLWCAISRILQNTPHSRLLLHHGTRDLDKVESSVPRNIIRTLAVSGIDPDRLEFVGRRNLPLHLETVSRCDIALDTFPYSGHTTTGDALWMGVPVVTLGGSTHASRVSAGLLARLRLEDWIAASLDDYALCAANKAQALPALSALRRELRTRMSQSSICNPRVVVRELENVYRGLLPSR